MASKALPVGTCDESYLPRLVFQPPPGIRNDAHKDFHKMRLDKHHYQRSYMLCRGSGGSPKDCARRIAADTFITPQNPAIEAHKKELVDGIECMAVFGDAQRCQHHLEAIHRLSVAKPVV
eukprot:Selendium_serpulae@DN3461_c0_g1_i1.p2